jgi:hypothetical protein
VAAATPALPAPTIPNGRGCSTIRTRGSRAAARRAVCREPSLEPFSTITSSRSRSVWRRTLSIAAPRYGSPL